MEKINKIVEKMMKALKSFTTIIFIFMIIIVLLQVANRHFLPFTVPWTSEASQYSFVLIVFFGSIVAFYEREHIVIRTLTNRIPIKYRGYTRLIVNFSFGIYVYLALTGAIEMMQRTWLRQTVALRVFGIRRGHLYLTVVIALVIFALVIIFDTVMLVKKLRNENI